MPLSEGVSVSELDAEYKRISEELKFRVDIISMNQNGFSELIEHILNEIRSLSDEMSEVVKARNELRNNGAVVSPVVPPVVIDLSRSDEERLSVALDLVEPRGLSSDTDLTIYSQNTELTPVDLQYFDDKHLCNFPPGVHKFRPQVSRLKLRVSQARKLRSECPICLDEFEVNGLVRVVGFDKCKCHSFCYKCFVTHMRSSFDNQMNEEYFKCPMCRNNVKKVEIRYTELDGKIIDVFRSDKVSALFGFCR